MFHDLRRTAVTNALLAGIAEVNIMEMCGWRTNARLKRYALALDNRAQDSGRKLEAFMDAQQPKMRAIGQDAVNEFFACTSKRHTFSSTLGKKAVSEAEIGTAETECRK
jgi:hypothetical protein